MKRGAWAKSAATTKPPQKEMIAIEGFEVVRLPSPVDGWQGDSLYVGGRLVDWGGASVLQPEMIGSSITLLHVTARPQEMQDIYIMENSYHPVASIPIEAPLTEWKWNLVKQQKFKTITWKCKGISLQEDGERIRVTEMNTEVR